jgi:hypothetical protein
VVVASSPEADTGLTLPCTTLHAKTSRDPRRWFPRVALLIDCPLESIQLFAFLLSLLDTSRVLLGASLYLYTGLPHPSCSSHAYISLLSILYLSIPVHFCPHFYPPTTPMGFFDHLQKGGAFSLQAKKTQVRKVVQTKPAAPTRAPVQNPDSRSPRDQSSSERSRKTHALKARSVSSDADARLSKRLTTPSRTRKRPTPETRLSSDDDDVSDSDTSFEMRKRARTSASAEPDPERRIRSVKAFSDEGSRPFKMVHAADITSGQKAGKFKPAFGAASKPKEILLQYPSASQKERYACLVIRLIVKRLTVLIARADSTPWYPKTTTISGPSTILSR